jgi:hypothetical protein
MGILGKRKQNEESVAVSGNGQRVWMENCVRCGGPLTILAATRPQDPMCTPCHALVEASGGLTDDDGS